MSKIIPQPNVPELTASSDASLSESKTGSSSEVVGSNASNHDTLKKIFSLNLESINPTFLTAWSGMVELAGVKTVADKRKFVRRLFETRSIYHTGQTKPYSKKDVDTLIWLMELYGNPKKETCQPLPFERKPENFWKHLIGLEKMIKSANLLWNSSLVGGFESRSDCKFRLEDEKVPVSTVTFRVSNSQVGKGTWVAAFKRSDLRVSQHMIKIGSTEDLKKWIKKNTLVKTILANGKIYTLKEAFKLLSSEKRKHMSHKYAVWVEDQKKKSD
jgi:hypothetical protein